MRGRAAGTGLLLDGRPLQDRSSVRGIGTYVRGLLDGLTACGAADDVVLLLARGPTPPEVTSTGAAEAPLRLPGLPRQLQPLADPLVVAAALRRLRPRLYHGVEYGQPLAAAVPVVVTVHDLIPFVVEDGYRWQRRERLLAVRLLPRADAIIAVSRATAADAVRVAGVDPGRIHVVHQGVAPAFAPAPGPAVAEVRRRLGISRPYLLAVGTFEPRKRIETLARVAALVRRERDVDLVITGEQSVFTPRVTLALEREGLEGVTHLPGHVSLGELVALYSGAACLVFTSSYEGFGLPPLEAMACGTPAVMFDNSALPEAAGDAGVLVPDGDAEAMAGAVVRLLSEPAEAERRRRRGREWAASFTWERTARRTLDVYAAALGAVRPPR